jgi:hypothetical protein
VGYPLSIVRVKQSLVHALPLRLEPAAAYNPLGGPFDGFTRARLSYAVGKFPFAQKREGVKDQYDIDAPGGGRLEVWITRDGHIFLESQAGLELALSLYLELKRVHPLIAIEDPQRGWLHDEHSFRELISGEPTARRRHPATDADESAA